MPRFYMLSAKTENVDHDSSGDYTTYNYYKNERCLVDSLYADTVDAFKLKDSIEVKLSEYTNKINKKVFLTHLNMDLWCEDIKFGKDDIMTVYIVMIRLGANERLTRTVSKYVMLSSTKVFDGISGNIVTMYRQTSNNVDINDQRFKISFYSTN